MAHTYIIAFMYLFSYLCSSNKGINDTFRSRLVMTMYSFLLYFFLIILVADSLFYELLNLTWD